MTHTVLVVEDEEDLREMMRDALELNGYAVVTAQDGQEALDELRRDRASLPGAPRSPDAGMNGWDFFAECASGRSWPRSRRRALVGDDRAPEGATRVLQKPIMFDQLLSVVREYCEPC